MMQAAHHGVERKWVDWIGQTDDNWRYSALFGAPRQLTPRGSCHYFKEGSGEVTAGVEASQQLSDESQTKRRHTNITLIQCYDPTNDGEDTDKDAFYQQLQAEVGTALRHDLTIVMGDLDAKGGNDNMYCDMAMRKHGCSTRNENEERLIDFCNINKFVIGETLFPHQVIHKLT